MENQKFEELFREAFTGAEVAPSTSVWLNVELDLEKASGEKKKGYLLFFQLLAAASAIFAMGIGGVYYLQSSQEANLKLAYNQKIAPQNQAGRNQDLTPSETKKKSTTLTGKRSNTQKNLITSVEPVVADNQNLIATTENAEYSDWGKQPPLPRLVEISKAKLILPVTAAPDPGMVLLARLQDQERKFQPKKKKVRENLWTSIGVGVGSYNPNTSSATAGNVTSFGNPVSTPGPTAGSSYSAAVSVASKVGSRLVIQGGVTYLSQNAEFTSSTTAMGGQASLNDFIASSDVRNDGGYLVTNPYKVNSNLQYVGIPVQAGYILIDRDFAVQLNGGISTDLFLQNTLTPENENLEKITQGSGSDSPYRTVNFSGLVGTELSYKVGDRYRVAVNPELRYALNSIYKNDVASDISPVTFDVALRFRYIFN